MKKTRLSNVRRILEGERRETRDVYAPLSALRIAVDDASAPLERRYRAALSEGKRERALRLSAGSIDQLCSVAGLPAGFLERLPASLGLKTFRCLLEASAHADGRSFLFRLQGDRPARLRAVLPQSHVCLDDLDILSEVTSATRGTDPEVVSLKVDEDTFFLRILLDQKCDVGSRFRSDPVFPAVDLITSETGRRPLELRNCIFRVVCTNGMTTVSDAHKAFRSRYTRLDRVAFQRALHGTLEECTRKGPELAGLLAQSRGTYVRDPRAEVARIFRTQGLGSPRGRIGRWVSEEVLRDLTVFGVRRFDIVQAFTAVARGLEHRDRMRLEDAMGAYVLEEAGTDGSGSATG